jgi:hypothetical protein
VIFVKAESVGALATDVIIVDVASTFENELL